MSKTIRITIILLSYTWHCNLQERSSSYLTFSFLKDLNEGSRGIGKFHAESELACTQQCDTDNSCYEALFYQALKRCSAYQKKEIRFSDIRENEKDEKPRI